jgi:hypothetical protein
VQEFSFLSFFNFFKFFNFFNFSIFDSSQKIEKIEKTEKIENDRKEISCTEPSIFPVFGTQNKLISPPQKAYISKSTLQQPSCNF